MNLLESQLPRTLLGKIAERKIRESSSEKKFDPYFELNRIGIPIEKRREIVEEAYSFFGRIFLKPMVFKVAIREVKENNLLGEEAIKRIKFYLNMTYSSQNQENSLEA